MALGASVPELFASLIGVFVTKDDIGTGSIIGSSCFNLIAVPAACAFVAAATFERKLTISPIPVMRNSAFYAITILVLLLIIKDNKVDIPEAVILLLFFVMYMAFMIFSAQVTKKFQESQQSSLTSSYISNDSAIAGCNKHHYNPISGSNNQRREQSQQLNTNHDQQVDVYDQFYLAKKDSQLIANYNSINEKTPLVSTTIQRSEPNFRSSNDACRIDLESISLNLGVAIKNSTCLVKNLDHDFPPSLGGLDSKFHYSQKSGEHHEWEEENWLSSNWILMPMLPVTLSMSLLTPCKFKNTCWTIWTFVLSISLIGGLTYISVWMVHLFGQTVGIPDTISGMTILSWGTGIPELIASIVLIKKTAQADMAICNTIGSNVIDVSFCLSVPW